MHMNLKSSWISCFATLAATGCIVEHDLGNHGTSGSGAGAGGATISSSTAAHHSSGAGGSIPVTEWAKPVGASGREEPTTMRAMPDGSGLLMASYFEGGASVAESPIGTAPGYYVARLDQDGVLQWGAVGTGNFSPDMFHTAFDIDADGSGFLAAWATGVVDFGGVTADAGAGSIVVAKIAPNGATAWVRPIGTSTNSFGLGDISVSSSGSYFVSGVFSTDVTFDDHTLTGAQAMFLVKYDASGDVKWAKTASGGSSTGQVMAKAPNGGVYLTGGFDGTVNFGTGGTLNGTLGYVAKYTASGKLSWARKFGNRNGVTDVVATPDGGVQAAGWINDEVTQEFNGNPVVSSGLSDGYMIRFKSNGQFRWVQTVANGVQAELGSLTVLPDGSSYAALFLDGSVTIAGTTVGEEDLGYTAGLVKFSPSGEPVWAKQVGGGVNSVGVTSVRSPADGSLYFAGRFSAQFVNPIVISGSTLDNYATPDTDAFIARMGLVP
jgi:hypothetical protein